MASYLDVLNSLSLDTPGGGVDDEEEIERKRREDDAKREADMARREAEAKTRAAAEEKARLEAIAKAKQEAQAEPGAWKKAKAAYTEASQQDTAKTNYYFRIEYFFNMFFIARTENRHNSTFFWT